MCRRMMENCPSSNLPGYGPALLIKRPVRTRMQGVVGAGGEKPPATRLRFNLFKGPFWYQNEPAKSCVQQKPVLFCYIISTLQFLP